MADDVLTRNENDELAVRVVSTSGDTSTNPNDVYTRDENGKLCVRVTGGGDQHNLGYFATLQALQEAYPTAEAGDWAIVGATDTVWIWDEDTSAWVDSDQKGQVTSVNNQTGAVTLDINDVAPTQTDKSGYVLGTDGFVAGWVKPEIVQRSALPQASEEEVNNIYEYVGTTDANYTNGYFYKCVSDGLNPATYSWTQVNVQPAPVIPDPLPSQTGNAGKFLTTNGTDASWSMTLPNETYIAGTGGTLTNNSLKWYGYDNNKFILYHFIGNDWKQFIDFEYVSNMKLIMFDNGRNKFSFQENDFVPYQSYNQCLGSVSAIWKNVYANCVTTTKLNNGADIIIPTTGGTMAVVNTPSTMPTLAVADWSSNTQTVNVTGVTATNTVFVSPAPASATDYASAGIICTAQGAGTLTFTCTTVPSNAITVNVVCL